MTSSMTAVNAVSMQKFPKLSLMYLVVNKRRHVWHTLSLFRKFVGDVKILPVVLRPEPNPHCALSRLGSLISQHIFSRSVSYIFQKCQGRKTAVISAFLPTSFLATINRVNSSVSSRLTDHLTPTTKLQGSQPSLF